MNTEIYIDKIISSLKMKLDKDNRLYRNSYEGELILSEVNFRNPLAEENLDEIKDIYLPKEYISFLKISNWAEFFVDDYKGSQALLKLYSLEEIIEGKKFYTNNLKEENLCPIGVLLDNCDLVIDELALKNKESYLKLSDGSKTFQYEFQEWLDKFIIAQGNEFWLLDTSYYW